MTDPKYKIIKEGDCYAVYNVYGIKIATYETIDKAEKAINFYTPANDNRLKLDQPISKLTKDILNEIKNKNR